MTDDEIRQRYHTQHLARYKSLIAKQASGEKLKKSELDELPALKVYAGTVKSHLRAMTPRMEFVPRLAAPGPESVFYGSEPEAQGNPMTREELRRGAKTAMSRKAVSAPMRLLESKGHLRGRMLDYGAGKGFDADHFGMEKYDPTYWPARPSGQFNTITCNYVLNVVPPEAEDEILDDIAGLLAPHGTAYISVRRDVERDGLTGSGTYQRRAHPDLPVLVERKGEFAIYTISRGAGMATNPADEEEDVDDSEEGECCEDCDTCAADGCYDEGTEESCETCGCCTECCCSCVEE